LALGPAPILNAQARYAAEVPRVVGDEGKVMVQGNSGNEQIGVFNAHAFLF
jgi:hypothetical protein